MYYNVVLLEIIIYIHIAWRNRYYSSLWRAHSIPLGLWKMEIQTITAWITTHFELDNWVTCDLSFLQPCKGIASCLTPYMEVVSYGHWHPRGSSGLTPFCVLWWCCSLPICLFLEGCWHHQMVQERTQYVNFFW